MLVFYVVNLFLASVPILYPLKTSESRRFSGVFRGIKWSIGQKWVNNTNYLFRILSFIIVDNDVDEDDKDDSDNNSSIKVIKL